MTERIIVVTIFVTLISGAKQSVADIHPPLNAKQRKVDMTTATIDELNKAGTPKKRRTSSSKSGNAALKISPETINQSGSLITAAIRGIYGIAGDINGFLDRHIEDLQASDNPTVARTGRVMMAAKSGFGIGYITSVVVIATGQLLLGNTLAAGGVVLTAVTLTNPIAMTCAAIGAIYYGWNALSDQERNDIIEKLTNDLKVGAELIKSLIRFVVDKTKEFLSSENLKEIKVFVANAAAGFGKSLGDVTKKMADIVSGSFDALKRKTGQAADVAADMASDAYGAVKEETQKATTKAKSHFNKTKSEDPHAELLKFQDLREKGILTEEEFQREKKRVLGN